MNEFFLTLGRIGDLAFIFCTYRRKLEADEARDACAFWRSRNLETVKRGGALFVDLRPAFREPLNVSRAQEVEAVEFDLGKNEDGSELVTVRDKTIRQAFDEC